MASAAPTARRASSHQNGTIKPEDWHEEVDDPHSRGEEGMQFSGDGLSTGVRILSVYTMISMIHTGVDTNTYSRTGDGRLDINIDERKPSIAGLLNRIQQTPLQSDWEDVEGKETQAGMPENAGTNFPLKMNLVVQVIGSRGDIQPFIALGKELKAHGHRVRLATHLAFRDVVLEAGLEFFCIGGDPAELMAFMVKNPSLMPALSTIRSGAIQKRRREMKEIIHGCWRSCIEMGDGTNLHQIKEDLWNDSVDYRRRPFVADAIIANPPSLAHIHCAQRLGIPLHMMFTWVH